MLSGLFLFVRVMAMFFSSSAPDGEKHNYLCVLCAFAVQFLFFNHLLRSRRKGRKDFFLLVAKQCLFPQLSNTVNNYFFAEFTA